MGSRHRGKGIVTYLRIIMMRTTVFVEPDRIRPPQLPQTSLDKQSLPRASATTISPACDLNCMSMRSVSEVKGRAWAAAQAWLE